jgi:hypothetical protein
MSTDTQSWDYRRLSIRSQPGASGPELGSSAVDQLLRTVQDMEHLEEKGWRLVSIACHEGEPGQQCYRIVLKRPSVVAVTGAVGGKPAPDAGGGAPMAYSSPKLGNTQRHSGRRAA